MYTPNRHRQQGGYLNCLQVSDADDGNTSAVLQRIGAPVGRLGNVTSPLYVVPNIVHFIWFSDDDDKQLTFINYISIVSAHRIQKPDTIMFHCNRLPSGHWWQRLWKEVLSAERCKYITNFGCCHSMSSFLTSVCVVCLCRKCGVNPNCISSSLAAVGR